MDSLYLWKMGILTKKEKLSGLLLLITRWSADKVKCYTEDKECRLGGGFEKDDVLVRVWWELTERFPPIRSSRLSTGDAGTR
jgi:hypothetical protein